MNLIKKFLEVKIIRFFIVGGLNALFGYGIFSCFIYIGFHYSLAGFCGTILGILFNFKTTGVIVFRSDDNSLIFRFFCVYGISYILSTFVLFLFHYFGLTNDFIGGAIILLPMAVITFLMMKNFVFKTK